MARDQQSVHLCYKCYVINVFLQISSRCSVLKLKRTVVSSLPVLYWLPKYSVWDYGMPDLIAGISVGIMHLPQGTAIVHHG